MTLRVALVGGPMYDGLYRALDGWDVDVVVHADHPTLNAQVAELLSAGERIDVLSTHGKYAPSQSVWLRPLDDLLDPAAVRELAPGAVDLCRVDGTLWSVPRLVDVRILWFDRDRIAAPPDDWDAVADLAGAGHRFGMPGRDSGLFGTFFELVAGAGSGLLGEPGMDRDVAEDAVRRLQHLAACGPAEASSWLYDDVDAALAAGEVDLAPAWPGATARLRASGRRLEPAPYPSGSERRVTYSGCHSWAIPATAGEPERAAELVSALCRADAQRLDAASGAMSANVEALRSVEPVDEVDARRLALTAAAIEEQMITYPPLERFPDIEGPGAHALHLALRGELGPAETVDRIEQAIRTATAR